MAELNELAPMARSLWDHVRDMSKDGNGMEEDMEVVEDFESLWIKWARRLLVSKRGVIVVAESDGKIVGYSFGYIVKRMSFKKLREVGFIEDFYIVPGKRRMGIGFRLNRKVLKWFGDNKIRHVYLDVLPHNKAARESYRKWGFEDSSITMHRKV